MKQNKLNSIFTTISSYCAAEVSSTKKKKIKEKKKTAQWVLLIIDNTCCSNKSWKMPNREKLKNRLGKKQEKPNTEIAYER